MKKELVDQLQVKYPIILRELYGDPQKTCMAWGIECGDGWYNLLDKLMGFLQWHADKNGYHQVVASQIKEKFGELRFYYTMEETDHMVEGRSPSYLEGAIDFAVVMSGRTCEECGMPGKIEVKGWVSCRCDECRNKESTR